MNIAQPFKKLIIKKTRFVTAAVFAFVCISATIVDKSNFAGEWALNAQKSELEEFGSRFTSKKLKVEQKENEISLERTTSFNSEDRTSAEKITLDGKETENTVYGNQKKHQLLNGLMTHKH